MTQRPQRPTRQKKSSDNHRLTIQLISALGLIIVGCAVLISGFIVPPIGEIHPSVLVAFGEILTFAGTVLGIDYRYKAREHEKRSDNAHNQ